MKCGDLPEDLGLVDLSPVEMMFWLYCPIGTPNSRLVIPPNLEQFRPIVNMVCERDCERVMHGYTYLTAKTLWVTPDSVGNRPGWHLDGFGTDDINYIWYDRSPTVFAFGDIDVLDDCEVSMRQMHEHAPSMGMTVYPNKHLLRLTPSVMHRSPTLTAAGMRTFVKVSLSDKPYNLAGNSINHELPNDWPMHERQTTRNHPHKQATQ